MKKISLFFLFLLIFISLKMQAQVNEKGSIELSPVVGYIISNSLLNSNLYASSVPGFQAGSWVNFFLNNRWSLRSGLFYQKMGTENDILIFNKTYSERTQYLTVPLLINYHFGSQRNWFVNYGINASSLLNIEADEHDGLGFEEVTDNVNSLQFGFNGGLGWQYRINPHLKMVLEMVSMVGLTDIREDKIGKNSYIGFNGGLVFKLK
ncbi:MAG: porin family protein [Flavobacteriaceae bacterium]|nr:porin family protein [Flavobacteriaceae bacterium]